ncbi:DUF559 domain-containing protein [Bifidobacterium catulorum]|uniref:DUF559 domain-containing protein n=1 Tax=Bifidobacterium catulorum TaxID=1630173 RepID=A0A2U2MRK5_9BIFI|nr:DUF559 domain-containing protein [Bifidobacterium catulorum]PWG59481.1 hypothetical protein DF200_07405 [Bifidobacterium catulorum]
MSDGSKALRELTDAKHRRMRVCSEAMERTRNELVFDLCTSLELQSVEPPRDSVLNKDICHAAVRNPAERYNLDGVRFHHYARGFGVTLVERRFRCVALPDVWMHYAAFLPLDELVVLTDNLMRRDGRLKRLTLEHLSRELEEGGRFKGVRRCRQALRLAREGTDSSYETRTRNAITCWSLPVPEVNVPVPRGDGKGFYYLDMAYPQWKIAIEYDGEHHRYQWKDDSRRREELELWGWIVITVFYEDLKDEESRRRLAERVAARIEQVSGKRIGLVHHPIEWVADGRRWRYGTLQGK